jgi:hypothetical protein
MKQHQNRFDRRKISPPCAHPEDRGFPGPDSSTGAEIEDPNLDPAIRNSELRIRNLEAGARNLTDAIGIMESGIRNFGSGIRGLASGIRNLEAGIQSLESRIRNLESRNPRAARPPEGNVKRKSVKNTKK